MIWWRWGKNCLKIALSYATAFNKSQQSWNRCLLMNQPQGMCCVHRSPVYMTQQTSRKSIGVFLSLMVQKGGKSVSYFIQNIITWGQKHWTSEEWTLSLNPLDMYTRYLNGQPTRAYCVVHGGPAQCYVATWVEGDLGENEHMYGLPLWCRWGSKNLPSMQEMQV